MSAADEKAVIGDRVARELAHQTEAVFRSSARWRKHWRAECSCGWVSEGTSGERAARALGDEHRATA